MDNLEPATANFKRMTSPLTWDIFCKVIDNYGDIGVCWRLARQLAGQGQRVRLWVDDASALRWMAPQGYPGVEVRAWTQPLDLAAIDTGDVLVEAFGCEVPAEFVAACAEAKDSRGRRHAWINLEYLSAESYVERSHGLPSPVMHGPGRGLTKHFFYPGFTPRTGGLLREPDLLRRQADFNATAWLQARGVPSMGRTQRVSLFCYEPGALQELLELLARQPVPVQLLVTAGRATAAVQACPLPPGLTLHFLPWLTQDDYDHLLWSCDLNFVRGEDSLVRALWAGRPFVWHIYPQHDNAHHDKLEAFLRLLDAPVSLRGFHERWNGIGNAPLPVPDLSSWGHAARQAREKLLGHPDLVKQLLDFVARIRR